MLDNLTVARMVMEIIGGLLLLWFIFMFLYFLALRRVNR